MTNDLLPYLCEYVELSRNSRGILRSKCRHCRHVVRHFGPPENISRWCPKRSQWASLEEYAAATCNGKTGLPILPESVCSWNAIVLQLTPVGVDRLQRCRAAGCNLIHKVNDHTTCVGMGGKKCGWLARWAACLNATTPFPNGTADCPHWA